MQTRKENTLIIPLMVVAGCLMYMISGGIRSSFGVVVPALADYTGLSYASVSFVVAVGQLMYGLTQPFFGILALKRSNGFVLTLGTIMMAVGLLAGAFSRSMVALMISVGLLFFSGTGAVCFGIVMGTISPVLGETRAAGVSGILNASSGIGASLFSPIMQLILAHFGVKALLIALSVPAFILIPVCLWIARLAAQRAPKASAGQQEGILNQLKRAVADPDYRRLMIGFGTCGFHMCIIQTHIYSQIVSYGIAESTASLAYTVFGLTGMVGSILCGLLCQRLTIKNVLGSLYGIRAVMVLIFLFLMPKNVISVFVFITVLGLTGDATVTPSSQIISNRFGPASLGFLFGITFVCHQVGGFLSSWLGGVFISSSGNYTAIWIADIVVCAVAALASYRIRSKRNG